MKYAGVKSQGDGPYHGLAAYMSVHDLNISRDQTSYASIFVGSGDNKKINFIQTGWMVNFMLMLLNLYIYIYIYIYWF